MYTVTFLYIYPQTCQPKCHAIVYMPDRQSMNKTWHSLICCDPTTLSLIAITSANATSDLPNNESIHECNVNLLNFVKN